MGPKAFEKLCKRELMFLRNYAPYDTGNLSQHAIRFNSAPNVFTIYVDETIASYMPFTNEPWLSPFWGGKKNPNEHWFNKNAELIAERLAKTVKGDLHDNTSTTSK